MKCTDINCKSFDYCEEIDTLYFQICYALRQSSIERVPSSEIQVCCDCIVPGCNYLIIMGTYIARTLHVHCTYIARTLHLHCTYIARTWYVHGTARNAYIAWIGRAPEFFVAI